MQTERIQITPYSLLAPAQRESVFAVRHAVFVLEQGITSEPEQDGKDAECEHVLVSVGTRVVGTARLMPIRVGGSVQIKVGRLALLSAYRKRGIGRRMVETINALLEERGVAGVMHAQAYLTDWYSALGWQAVGDTFLEAQIEHRKMVYRPQARQVP